MDNFLERVLHANGYLLPSTEADIAAYEEALAAHDIPPIPPGLDDPVSLLDSPPLDPAKIIDVKTPASIQQHDFAAAARSGAAISPINLEKMMKDFDRAKHKK